MDTHLSNKDIDKLVSGLSTAKEAKRAELHIETCESCRRRIDILSGILSKKNFDSVPGDHVKAAVLAEWHRMNSRVPEPEGKSRPLLKFAYGLAAVFLIAVSTYVAVTRVPFFSSREKILVASSSGDVFINNDSAGQGDPFENNDTLLTAPAASASLSWGSYNLYIGDSSKLRLADSGDENGFVFQLERGFVRSRSEGKLRYSFICGQYRVIPSGTEFTLNFVQGKLDVAVFSGGVTVSGAELLIDVQAGMRWKSDDPDRIVPINFKDEGEERGVKESGIEKTAGSDSVHENEATDTREKNGVRESGIDADIKRELKKEAREDIIDMKKERRRERQMRGGN